MHHGVEITDPAIVAAAELSHRYITDRFLPDKAIDLIDEAAARIKMEIDSKPEAMDRLDRRLIQLQDRARGGARRRRTRRRRSASPLIEEEIARLEREYADLEEVWKAEKARCRARSTSRKRSRRSSCRWTRRRRKGDWQKMSRAAVRQAAAARGAAQEGRDAARRATRGRSRSSCARRSAPKRSPRSCRARPASRCRR